VIGACLLVSSHNKRPMTITIAHRLSRALTRIVVVLQAKSPVLKVRNSLLHQPPTSGVPNLACCTAGEAYDNSAECYYGQGCEAVAGAQVFWDD